jgi:hypothetical protein
MVAVLRSLLLTLRTLAHSRAELHLEILALRHQLDVRQRTRSHRVRLARTGRWLWVRHLLTSVPVAVMVRIFFIAGHDESLVSPQPTARQFRHRT